MTSVTHHYQVYTKQTVGARPGAWSPKLSKGLSESSFFLSRQTDCTPTSLMCPNPKKLNSVFSVLVIDSEAFDELIGLDDEGDNSFSSATVRDFLIMVKQNINTLRDNL